MSKEKATEGAFFHVSIGVTMAGRKKKDKVKLKLKYHKFWIFLWNSKERKKNADIKVYMKKD